jgi:outer membrane protein assembly factor BamB
VVCGKNVWVADRAFRLSVMDAGTGELIRDEAQVSSVALSADGSAVYLRGSTGKLRKVDAQGKEIWSADARTNVLPSAPAEHDGVVFSATPTGRIIAFNAADGAKLWEYQATPRLYVFSDPVPADGRVYVTGMDGSVTSLRITAPPTKASVR